MRKHEKIGKIFKTIFSMLFGILFILPVVIMELIDCIRNRIFISKQFKKLKNAGYKISKVKDNGKKVYLFTFGFLVIKFLPNEIHDISFDGGKTYVSIFKLNVGTPQEKEYLKNMNYLYHICDYRDRDMYDSTEKFIQFILKNITVNGVA